MKNSLYAVILNGMIGCWLLVAEGQRGEAHIIYLRDDTRIQTESVWEQKAGCILTEAGLKALKKEKLPQPIMLEVQGLVGRPAKNSRQFLNFLQIRIGREHLKEYGDRIMKYVAEKSFIKYRQHDGVMSIDKSLVEKIEYEKVTAFQPIVEIQDNAFLVAAAAKRKELMKEWKEIKKRRMAAKTGTAQRKKLEKDEKAALALIELIGRDPFAYFMRNEPETINEHFLKNLDLDKETCILICGGKPEDDPDNPSVFTKDYGEQFEYCMDYCPVKE